MTAAAFNADPSPSNRAGARVLALEAMSMRELEIVFQRGATPDLDRLAGWEFRGTNTPGWARLAGIKKFIKGFYRDGDEVYGYNCPVVQSSLDEPWIAKPDDAAPKRFGFYKVDADSDDVYLGKAYDAVGPLRVATSFFVLERHRPGLREVGSTGATR